MNEEPLPQPAADLCSEEEVERLVRHFYGRVREDALLGPVFEAHVHDWEVHMQHLVDFWSALLRGTRRFRGAPMQKHLVIDELREALFERWLQLFRQTTSELGNVPMQRLADDAAARIAGNFWRRFQMSRWPSLPLHPGSG
ncbi:group III truncated hemoglobin [Stenotrophomonas mori]|uniref:Group III truncated hemoglobin n=1 Tax=Stenotrophomonas mori TaxID=2871096 RepID=A0ABT0SGH4_9GAMM|nr:group III truncated hemoglobin [Stenotrophomonas mori]MCL7714178.1 group III truncated hemoglobin [Stenotrophomonas mori]